MTEEQVEKSERITRYRGLLILALLLVGAGVATGAPVVVVASLVPLAFVASGTLSSGSPVGDRLRITREVRPEVALPGQPVEVTLTVENVSDSPVPDLRVLDGVPPELGVLKDSPRTASALRPGESTTATYTLAANRGAYEFEPAVLRVRNVTGTVVSTAEVTADGDGSIECRVTAEDIPLRQETTSLSGSVATDTGGTGVEFFATREYQTGDPPNRIDWRRYARRGELSTVLFKEQRASRIAVVIDGWPSAHVTGDPSLPTGATLCAYAATLAIEVLVSDGHRVDVAALGTVDPTRGDRPAWVLSEGQTAFDARVAAVCNAAATGAEDAVATDRSLRADGGSSVPGPASTSRQLQQLLSRFEPGAQVLFCTPTLDDDVLKAVESFIAAGHPTTVLSPAVTSDSVAGRLAALERADRLDALRHLGATVVDWDREEPLPIALKRTIEGGIA